MSVSYAIYRRMILEEYERMGEYEGTDLDIPHG